MIHILFILYILYLYIYTYTYTCRSQNSVPRSQNSVPLAEFIPYRKRSVALAEYSVPQPIHIASAPYRYSDLVSLTNHFIFLYILIYLYIHIFIDLLIHWFQLFGPNLLLGRTSFSGPTLAARNPAYGTERLRYKTHQQYTNTFRQIQTFRKIKKTRKANGTLRQIQQI